MIERLNLINYFSFLNEVEQNKELNEVLNLPLNKHPLYDKFMSYNQEMVGFAGVTKFVEKSLFSLALKYYEEHEVFLFKKNDTLQGFMFVKSFQEELQIALVHKCEQSSTISLFDIIVFFKHILSETPYKKIWFCLNSFSPLVYSLIIFFSKFKGFKVKYNQQGCWYKVSISQEDFIERDDISKVWK